MESYFQDQSRDEESDVLMTMTDPRGIMGSVLERMGGDGQVSFATLGGAAYGHRTFSGPAYEEE